MDLTIFKGKYKIISKAIGHYSTNCCLAALDVSKNTAILANGDITKDFTPYVQVKKNNDHLEKDELAIYYNGAKNSRPVLCQVVQYMKSTSKYVIDINGDFALVSAKNLSTQRFEIGQRVKTNKFSSPFVTPGTVGTIVYIANQESVDPILTINPDNSNCPSVKGITVNARVVDILEEENDPQVKALELTISKKLSNPVNDNYEKIIKAVYEASHNHKKEENLKFALCLIEDELEGKSRD